MAQICIVLDTNVLLSGTAYPNSIPGKIVSAWRGGSINVILSQYILDELKRVLPRLNHRLSWSSIEIRDFVDSLAFLTDLVDPVKTAEPLLRDKADQPVLGTFLAANADYLVTGDKDLLALSEIYPIVTPADFWRLHGD
ncbi:MAG: putative toxin-antitoxin system toxin component, PIN family [Methylobacter sp.]|nr:MAG: putative toxin-antitoxin system toxin component, PIN family [Methylobacter sp.]